MDVLILHTVGRRSSQPRQSPLAWFADGQDAWQIVASGGRRHPDWYLNLMAHPDRASIELPGGDAVPATPHRVDGADRAPAWQRITVAQPRYAKYLRKSDREYPVVRFTLGDGIRPRLPIAGAAVLRIGTECPASKRVSGMEQSVRMGERDDNARRLMDMATAAPLRGLSTVNLFAADHAAARQWYTQFLGVEPYFERPGYVEFRIGDYQAELGIIDSNYVPGTQSHKGRAGVVVYWHVDDVDTVLAKAVGMGATQLEAPEDRGQGFITATAVDPFGNLLGIMYNPHYLEILSSLKPA